MAPAWCTAAFLAWYTAPCVAIRGGPCLERFQAPPAPLHATDLGGVALPDVCFNETGPHHVFVIGDWVGILPGHQGNEQSGTIRPADHTKPGFSDARYYVWGVDDQAQQRVAAQMKARAPASRPDYILNVGDNFYWAGVESHCGAPPFQHIKTGQWEAIFESMYSGVGLDGKQWLGCLGNHDYGGWKFTSAWDQAIGYTWGGPQTSGRWMTPALYWRVKVRYIDFAVDYYFVDSNKFDAMSPETVSGHNICSTSHNWEGGKPTCGPQGPVSIEDCPGWFGKLWAKEMTWLEEVLPKSIADWQIVVTHFPPAWGSGDWRLLSKKHGIDLIVTGHQHMQQVIPPGGTGRTFWPNLQDDFLEETAWIVSGGGGGVTSEQQPDPNGWDDMYGFMDLTLSKSEIIIEAISHGGQIRKTVSVKQRLATYKPAVASIASTAPSGDQVPQAAAAAQVSLSPAMDNPNTARHDPLPKGVGCGTTERTFYMYRVQNDENYPDENINTADLPGILWYLHHEVVTQCPRKFGISRIRRLKVTMKNTCDLYNEQQTQYGPYVAFDAGQCTVPNCAQIWQKYGQVVGCQHIPYNVGVYAAYCRPPNCRQAHWYSLPGKCPSQTLWAKTPDCIAQEPTGACPIGSPVTGERGCTYHIEQAGELLLDEIYYVGNVQAFCAGRKMEYNNQTDHGVGISFWDGIYDPAKCTDRLNTVRAKFKAKYPDMPASLDEPRCDWFKSDPGDYLHRTGSGFPRPPAAQTPPPAMIVQ